MNRENAVFKSGFAEFHDVGKDFPPDRNVKQTETNNHEAHNGAAAECYLQTLVEGLGGSCAGAVAGVSGSDHAKVTGKTREETTGQEGQGCPGALDLEDKCQKREKSKCYNKENANYPVLRPEIRHGAFFYVARDFLGLCRARIRFHHGHEKIIRKNQSDQ
jgi:hypothetical protein